MKKNVKNFAKKYYKWIIVFICVIGFLEIAEDVWEDEIMRADIVGYDFISHHFISDTFTPIIKFITNFGSAYILLALDAILTVAFLIRGRKDLAVAITLNLIIISALNLLLKNIVQRPRPDEYRIINETGYSFPSGHSMISMAFYGFLIYLIYKNIKSKYAKWISIVVLGALILCIGVSRIYLGVHYTSDVLAGFLISVAYLFAYTSILKRITLTSEISKSSCEKE